MLTFNGVNAILYIMLMKGTRDFALDMYQYVSKNKKGLKPPTSLECIKFCDCVKEELIDIQEKINREERTM